MLTSKIDLSVLNSYYYLLFDAESFEKNKNFVISIQRMVVATKWGKVVM